MGDRIDFRYTPLDIGTERHDGYGDTRSTWEVIKTWVDWRDRYCLDIGACCGFVTDKLIREGCAKKVVAIEKNEDKCALIPQIVQFNGGKVALGHLHVVCVKWMDATVPSLPEGMFWEILALNIVHHFFDETPDRSYKTEAIAKMLALPWKHIIFEADFPDCDLIRDIVAGSTAMVTNERSPGRPSRDLLMLTNTAAW
jgi:hypothetical protein